MKSPSSDIIDQRRSSRLELSLPCVLRIARPDRVVFGTTLNVSRTGALIECEPREHDLPSEGEILAIELALPRNGPGERRCVRGHASVVRVVGDHGVPRLALQFGKLDFGVWREERFSLVS